jgi:hypothetical protein
MAVDDSFLALMAFTLAEAYFLHRTLVTHETLRAVLFSLLVINVLLKCLYTIFIWPFFVNPLRHLPKVPVSITPREHYQNTPRIATKKCFVGLLEQSQVL